jgi:hypothetical protein
MVVDNISLGQEKSADPAAIPFFINSPLEL